MRVRVKSRKPGVRCDDCGVHPDACICAVAPDLDTETRVVIFMHCREKSLSSGTARLARKALRRCEIRLHGAKDVPTDVLNLAEPGRRALVLFPTATARTLDAEFLRELKGPYTLIVPDGSWRQAARCARRIPGLDGLPRVKLPKGPPSEYRLRAQASLECVCTYEAIARALGVIEGRAVRERLEAFLRLKVDATRRRRGTAAVQALPRS
ncbi:MAG TPA: tRNA-uridine aminocarboxypropyltransferase [Planctomycetota bacterium]|nr:tRNA-uridine aminocarboxypropyltransferase [Planctomycetota bacterium]